MSKFLSSFIKSSRLLEAEQFTNQLFSNVQEKDYIKVAHELGKIDSTFIDSIDVEKELIKASQNFRSMFKEAALREGYTEDYVYGVFDTSEKLMQKVALGFPGANVVMREALPLFNSAARVVPEEAEQAGKVLPPVTPIQSAFKDRPYVPPTDPAPAPAVDLNAPTWGSRIKDTLMGGKDPNLWNGKGWQAPVTGATIGGLGGSLVGAPVTGSILGGLAGAIPGIGLRRLGIGALGAGGLYEGAKELYNSGAGSAGLKGLAEGAGMGPDSDGSTSNKLMGGIGGMILAMILARQMGLGGLGGTAAGLLGAYGGYKYLPGLLQKMRSGMSNGSMGNWNPGLVQYSPPLGPAGQEMVYGGQM